MSTGASGLTCGLLAYLASAVCLTCGLVLVIGTYRRWPWLADPESEECLFCFWIIGLVGRGFLLAFNYVMALGLGAVAVTIIVDCS